MASLLLLRYSLSDVLFWPLVAGMLFSLYIAKRTRESSVRNRATMAFLTLLSAFAILHIPQLVKPYFGGGVLVIAARFTDYVAYLSGEGWLSQIWLISPVVDGVKIWTKTRIWESRELKWLLHAIVILGFLWLALSFIVGQPGRAFGMPS